MQACCQCNGNGTCSKCKCVKARRSRSSACLQCKKNCCRKQRATTNTAATSNDLPASGPSDSSPKESLPSSLSATEMHSINTNETPTNSQMHATNSLGTDVALLISLSNSQPPNHDTHAVRTSGHTEADNIHNAITSHTFTPVPKRPFKWGNIRGEILSQDIKEVYEREMGGRTHLAILWPYWYRVPERTHETAESVQRQESPGMCSTAGPNGHA